jgi:hypothetical protein
LRSLVKLGVVDDAAQQVATDPLAVKLDASSLRVAQRIEAHERDRHDLAGADGLRSGRAAHRERLLAPRTRGRFALSSSPDHVMVAQTHAPRASVKSHIAACSRRAA